MQHPLKYLFVVLCILPRLNAFAQYPAQVGIAGNTAIPANSAQFWGWASTCTVQRGYLNIDSMGLGCVTGGDSSNATGRSDNSIVSLGDGGVATLTFPGFIFDGPGADFAVFENGFQNPVNDSQAFLELAFVEVSSDGEHYFRFPAQSLTQTQTQIPGSGVYMYANLINNLAGKYIGGYGTPFDLATLAGTPGLDISRISHVKVIDVIGDINGSPVSRDSSGRVINDPFPTPFPTGGFDLDAVGVIHLTGSVGVHHVVASDVFSVSPVPVTDAIQVKLNSYEEISTMTLADISGKCIFTYIPTNDHVIIDCSDRSPGIYFLTILDNQGTKWVEKVVKY